MKRNTILVSIVFVISLISICFWQYRLHLLQLKEDKQSLIQKIIQKYDSPIIGDWKFDYDNYDINQRAVLNTLQIDEYYIVKGKVYSSDIIISDTNFEQYQYHYEDFFSRHINNTPYKYIYGSFDYIENFPSFSTPETHFHTIILKEEKQSLNSWLSGWYKGCLFKSKSKIYTYSQKEEAIIEDLVNKFFLSLIYSLVLSISSLLLLKLIK